LEDHNEVRLSMPLCGGLGELVGKQKGRMNRLCGLQPRGKIVANDDVQLGRGLSNSRVRHGSHSSRFCWSCQERWCSPGAGVSLRRSAPLPSRLVRPRFCVPHEPRAEDARLL
jgi:hypothetical protein